MFKLIVLTGAALLVSYLFSRLWYLRFTQYGHIPQLPSHLLWGHLKLFGEFTSRGVQDRHPDKIFEEMWISIGRPPVMLVDLRPINAPLLLVASHDVAEQISKPSKLFPYSTTKSPTWGHMIPIIGETSIIGKEGSDWKDLRKRYNPGFSSQHLWRLLPLILDKMGLFCNFIDEFAVTGEEFSLEKLISNLTFDIIGVAVMEADLNAQQKDPSKQGELVRLFNEIVKTYSDDKNNFPWWVVPLTTLKRYRLAKRIDVLIRQEIQQKYTEAKIQQEYTEVKENAKSKRSRSILALSFQDTRSLTPQLLLETSHQVRTFLFAGHDTNTSMLEWAFYELSRTPRALKAVRQELDELLGPNPDPRAICATFIEKGENIFPRMRYINAVIKETLRLHPPAGTARMTGNGFTVVTGTGEEYLVDGTVMYPAPSIIHRDPNVYGDTADVWIPERWLGETAIPPSAWRPFERGPRNCIGLELANLESRVIIAIVARKYDFIKTGLGESLLDEKGLPSLNDQGQYRVKSELYNTRRMTSQPVDGTTMKVKLAT
ncbi:cytochrome P450 [Nemania sp. FL0031]|nr:cytochrome P450 [Nemania sp. FL0031]